jgi:hypothetical protein
VKKFLLIVILFLVPAASFAADDLLETPRWSFEVKGGLFTPDLPQWEDYYDGDMTEFGIAWAYKIFRQLEVGVEGIYSKSSGMGFAPIHGELNATVDYMRLPLNVFVLVRGVFDEGQVLVPYVGGGWTRVFYQQEISDQGSVKGFADGYHARAGVQVLLDEFDPEAANNMYHDYGIQHTYFFLEGGLSRAMIDAVDPVTGASGPVNLGGKSVRAGLLFEY